MHCVSCALSNPYGAIPNTYSYGLVPYSNHRLVLWRILRADTCRLLLATGSKSVLAKYGVQEELLPIAIYYQHSSSRREPCEAKSRVEKIYIPESIFQALELRARPLGYLVNKQPSSIPFAFSIRIGSIDLLRSF